MTILSWTVNFTAGPWIIYYMHRPLQNLPILLSMYLYLSVSISTSAHTHIYRVFSLRFNNQSSKLAYWYSSIGGGDVNNGGEASIFPAEFTKYKVIMDGTTGLLLSDPFSHHENVDVLKLSTLPGNEIVAMYIRYPMANLHCFIPMETRRISGKYISYSLSWLSTSKSISWRNLLIKDQFLCWLSCNFNADFVNLCGFWRKLLDPVEIS